MSKIEILCPGSKVFIFRENVQGCIESDQIWNTTDDIIISVDVVMVRADKNEVLYTLKNLEGGYFIERFQPYVFEDIEEAKNYIRTFLEKIENNIAYLKSFGI